VRITLPSGVPAELARPEGREAEMGLVVAPDVMGLRPLFDDLCARLAGEQGWAVCAVEPFPGQQDLALEDRLATGVAGLDDGQVVANLIAGADATECERVGLIGFCMGGMYALKAAGSGRFDRLVSFYGMIRVPEHFAGPGQGEPLEMLGPHAGRVLAILGGRDHFTPEDDVEDLRATGANVVVYVEAEHGFVHDPARPAHRPDDAADAWRRAVDWLRS
jgi:carboxymethylenebutenolidase